MGLPCVDLPSPTSPEGPLEGGLSSVEVGWFTQMFRFLISNEYTLIIGNIYQQVSTPS